MRRRRAGVTLRGPARLASTARLLAQTPSTASSSSLSSTPPRPPATVDTVFSALRPARHLSMALASLCAAFVLHGAAVAATASIKNRRANRRHTVAVATDTTEAWPEEPQPPPPKKKPAEPTAQTAAQPTSTSTSTTVATASSAPAGLSSSSLLPAGLSAGGFGVGGGDGGGGDGRGLAPSTVPVATARPTASITPARARTRAPPRYPAAARKSGATGTVTLQIHVDEHGTVTDVRVVDSTPAGLFDDAAIEAARRFTFDPAVTAGGDQVASWVRQTIRFTLEAS